jgi:hypothetical protein
MPDIPDKDGDDSARRTRAAWEPRKPRWQLIPAPATDARRRMMRRIAYGLPFVVLAVWCVGAALHGFASTPFELGLVLSLVSVFMSRFLYRRSRGLPAEFGSTAITEKSTPVTIDSVETMAIVCSAGWVLFGVVMWFVPLR